MSHNIRYATYPENVNKTKVQKEWDDYAAHEDWGEGCTGLPGKIKWLSNTFKSYEEAQSYIERIDSGYYDQLAVRYCEYPKLKPSKTLENLHRIALDANKRYNDLSLMPHYKDMKSCFISCRKCCSKINREYLTSNNCPVCHADMRPDSTLKRIAQLKKSAKNADKNYISRQKYEQEKTKPTINWLVKIEYHT